MQISYLDNYLLFQSETRKLKETTHKLNEAQNLLEKQLEESRKQQQKVLSAEIQSR